MSLFEDLETRIDSYLDDSALFRGTGHTKRAKGRLKHIKGLFDDISLLDDVSQQEVLGDLESLMFSDPLNLIQDRKKWSPGLSEIESRITELGLGITSESAARIETQKRSQRNEATPGLRQFRLTAGRDGAPSLSNNRFGGGR